MKKFIYAAKIADAARNRYKWVEFPAGSEITSAAGIKGSIALYAIAPKENFSNKNFINKMIEISKFGDVLEEYPRKFIATVSVKDEDKIISVHIFEILIDSMDWASAEFQKYAIEDKKMWGDPENKPKGDIKWI
jgi:hypothetical protein